MIFNHRNFGFLLLAWTLISCTDRKIQSGNYGTSGATLNLSRTGDHLLSGQWKSDKKPTLGTLTSSQSLLAESFQIYIPECNKDLPVEITQKGNDLEVQIKALPACEIETQSYNLQPILRSEPER